MKVQTRAETINVHIGIQFAERRMRGNLILGIKFFEVFEVVSEPKIIIQSGGSKFVQWKGRSLETGKIRDFGVCDDAIAYSPSLYNINSVIVQEYLHKEIRYILDFWKKEKPSVSVQAPAKESRPIEDELESGHVTKKVEQGTLSEVILSQADSFGEKLREPSPKYILEILRKGRAVTLVNTQTGRKRQIVASDGTLLVDDKDIDYDAIHRLCKFPYCVDNKVVMYWFGQYKDFENGAGALCWTIIPDGLYFADEDGFGAEDNDEENVYCIINMDLEIIVPFQPMKDVGKALAETVII